MDAPGQHPQGIRPRRRDRRFSPGTDGIRDIPRVQRWEAERWNIGGNVWSLDQIEHVQIREHFRTEVYTGGILAAQLRDQARIVHEDGARWFQYDRENGVLHLTPLYPWYRGDFEQVKPDIFEYAAQYNVALVERRLMGGDCLNHGCVPSKGIIRSARAAASVRDSGTFGVRVPPGAAVDFAAAGHSGSAKRSSPRGRGQPFRPSRGSTKSST